VTFKVMNSNPENSFSVCEDKVVHIYPLESSLDGSFKHTSFQLLELVCKKPQTLYKQKKNIGQVHDFKKFMKSIYQQNPWKKRSATKECSHFIIQYLI